MSDDDAKKWKEHKKKERKREKKREKDWIRSSWIDRKKYMAFKAECKKNRRTSSEVLTKLCELYAKWGDRLFAED